MSDPIRTVVVVGGGVAALMAAVALARRVPGLAVTLAEVGGLEILEDIIGVARPFLRTFHQAMGVADDALWRRAGMRSRVAARMTGLGPAPFFRGLALPPSENGAPPHQLCFAAGLEARALGDLALAAACAEPLFHDPSQGPASSRVGYFLDLTSYREALRALAASAGVTTLRTSNLDVELAADGSGVAALRQPDGRRLTADLFVDASGRAAIVRSTLPGAWTSWRTSLPVDRLTLKATDIAQDTRPFDQIVAHADGWRYELGGLALEAGRNERASEPREVMPQPLLQGRLHEPFFGNVVAIGAAAVALEPIALAGIDLAVRHIDRLVALWPGRDVAAVERGLYNRRTALEADHAHDFARLHYAVSTREEPFWRKAGSAPLSDDLAHDLALFAERGRLAWREDDCIAPDERILLLAGLGLRPRRLDTLADGGTDDDALHRIRHRLRQVTGGLDPTWFRSDIPGHS